MSEDIFGARERSPAHNWISAAVLFETVSLGGVLVGAAVWAGRTGAGTPVIALLSLALGLWLERLYTVGHEAAHRKLFPDHPRLNDLVGPDAGVLESAGHHLGHQPVEPDALAGEVAGEVGAVPARPRRRARAGPAARPAGRVPQDPRVPSRPEPPRPQGRDPRRRRAAARAGPAAQPDAALRVDHLAARRVLRRVLRPRRRVGGAVPAAADEGRVPRVAGVQSFDESYMLLVHRLF
jgi:hypothetical protein